MNEDMISKGLIQRKLTLLLSYIKEMEDILQSPTVDIISDRLKIRTFERLLQLIVDTALSINAYMMRALQLTPVEDFQSTFETIAQAGVIAPALANRIAPSVGLRNKIVHKYEEVDMKRVIEDVRKELAQYREYMRDVEIYITSDTEHT